MEKYIAFLTVTLPNWRDFGASLAEIITFIGSVLHYKVMKKIFSLQTIAPEEGNLLNQRNFMVKRVALVTFEVLVLCSIASTQSESALTLIPYTTIFCIQCLIIQYPKGMGIVNSLSSLSKILSIFLMAFSLTDLSANYLAECSDKYRNSSLYPLIGPNHQHNLFQTLLKIALLCLQYLKLSFPHSKYLCYQSESNQVQDDLSYGWRFIKPISVFAFSACSLFYIIGHPSVVLICFMPITIGGYFLRSMAEPSRWYVIYTRFIMGYLIFEIVLMRALKTGIQLFMTFNDGHQDIQMIQQGLSILGLSMIEVVKTKINEGLTADFTYLLILAFFGGQLAKSQILKYQEFPEEYDSNSLKEQQTPNPSIQQEQRDSKNVEYSAKFQMVSLFLLKHLQAFVNKSTKISNALAPFINLTLILISAFYKQNCLSLIALPIIVSSKNVGRFIIHYISFSICFQIIMAFANTRTDGDWKALLTIYQCESVECANDWEQWLSIGFINKSGIMVDFFLLLCAVIVKQSQDTDELTEEQRMEQIENLCESPSFKSKLTYFCLTQMPIIFVFTIFLHAMNSSRSSDFLSTGYLFFALYFFLNFQKFKSKSASSLLNKIRIYNFLNLVMLFAFQVPLFVCPTFQAIEQGFVNHQVCARLMAESVDNYDFGGLKETDSQIKAFYILSINSIGLQKLESSSISWALIMLILITEVQHSLLSHPYYLLIKVPEWKEAKKYDQYMRVIKYIEHTHLQKLWSFKAIKEEIKILHSRLIRITESIKNSVHSNHLLWDFDQEENEQRQSLVSEASSHYEGTLVGQERNSFFDSDFIEGVSPEMRDKIEKHFQDILALHRNDIENLALDLLNRPQTPIVPLKLFNAAFENLLHNKFQQKYRNLADDKREMGDLLSLIRIDQRAIEEYLLEIGEKLQMQVQVKAKIELYHQENLGLKFISENGYEEILLRDGEYNFFSHLLNYQAKENDLMDTILKIDTERPLLLHQTGWIKFQFMLREYLWDHLIDQSLFMSLSKQTSQSIYTIDFTTLLSKALLSQSINMAYFSFFLTYLLNADLLSLFLPLSALLYALLTHPIPTKGYWKLVQYYQLTVFVAKFFYQFPLFCASPEFTFFSFEQCSYQKVPSEALIKRLDYIIGLHKYTGPASYPREQGILFGIMPDLIVLFMILNVKIYFDMTGKWNNLQIKNSIYDTPAFKCPEKYVREAELQEKQAKHAEALQKYNNLKFKDKLVFNIKHQAKRFNKFLMRVLPVYMKTLQANRDTRTNEDEIYVLHNVKRVKPGKDYFNQSFFSLLLIFVYNLFFFRSWTGQTHASALSSANLQRFSVSQVAVLFFILTLMMVERMLYRVRQTENERQNSLSKHQLAIKLVIHVILVVYVHIDIGLVVPKHNNITFDKKFPLVLMYLLWVYYFIQSALQIRHGYPQAPFKAPFIRDTSLLTVWAFRVYKAMPFLWEMKVIIDWTVTSTCLDLFQWFKLDDAFNYLYQCQVQNNDRASRREYSQRPMWEKFFQGFCFAFALILVILAPILLFSGINPIMVNNPVLTGELQIALSLNENGSTYDMVKTQAFMIEGLNQTEVDGLQERYAEGSVKFEYPKMQKMYFSPYSEYAWQISPPSLQKFISDYNNLKSDQSAFFDVKAKWVLKRDNPIGNEQATSQLSVRKKIGMLQPIIDALNEHQGEAIGNVTDHSKSTILIENLLPKFLKLGDSQLAQPLDVIPLLSNLSTFASAKLSLNHGLNDTSLYWTYQVLASDRDGVFKSTSNQDDHNLVLIVYNEQVIGSLFGTALQLSVVGLYATIVIAIGRFLRLAFDRISQRVIYEEMDPETTEQLFEICEGIYIAQLEGDLVKEKRLYDLLIRMYRSPETLIKINRQARAELNERIKSE
ncbi:hypothetical protein FGO68_gene11570 [Halteria grandinella]|uniref:Piezo non-specific cation channel R-Ras-binding domain-containing protein n=1 Tax=Halteria grandinella TaxID=5974 RepID=A0A8J8P7Y5_HALGN|nr:hypothetical protein FGO68_gene11570 [Halteria grandinella]